MVTQNGERNANTLAAIAIALVEYKRGIFPIFFGRYSAEAKSIKPTEKRRRPSIRYGAVVNPNREYVENSAKKMPEANNSWGIKEKERFKMQIKRNNNSVAAPRIAPIKRIDRFCATVF